jgi:hypothetical protein
MKIDSKGRDEFESEGTSLKKTTWWKSLYHMVVVNFRFYNHNYVECYDFDIEFFDNPAIAALVSYKW